MSWKGGSCQEGGREEGGDIGGHSHRDEEGREDGG